MSSFEVSVLIALGLILGQLWLISNKLTATGVRYVTKSVHDAEELQDS